MVHLENDSGNADRSVRCERRSSAAECICSVIEFWILTFLQKTGRINVRLSLYLMLRWFRQHVRLVLLVLWVGSTAIAVSFCATKFKLFDLYRLTKSGVVTDGKITDRLPNQHRRLSYSFIAEGRTYQWGGFAGDIGKEFDEISIGERVLITYDPADPGISTLGRPEPSLYSNLLLSIFISLMPTITFVILVVRDLDQLSQDQP